MRKILLAGLLIATLAPGAVLAGGVPEIVPVVLCDNCGAPSSSMAGLIVPPLLFLLVIGAAVGG